MTTLTFCTTLSPSGGPRGLHIECEIEGEVRDDNGTSEPYFAIVRIWIDGEELPRPGYEPFSLWERISVKIAKAAEADRDLLARAMDAEGWPHAGHAGDPDGRFIRPLELEAA